MVELSLMGVLTFVIVHIIFIVVSKFIFHKIDIIVYMLMLTFLLIFLLDISLGDVVGFTAALVHSIGG